ncbi:hypothetical protein GCM10017708_39100 [Arthrobacter citreus]
MANYTAADIKALRERTGAGMMDVKKALDEANGDADKAMELIRIKGLKGATKREGRSTAEGLVAAKVIDGTVGVMIELNCETDFVAKSAKFIELADKVLDAAVESAAADAETLLAYNVDGKRCPRLLSKKAQSWARRLSSAALHASRARPLTPTCTRPPRIFRPRLAFCLPLTVTAKKPRPLRTTLPCTPLLTLPPT